MATEFNTSEEEAHFEDDLNRTENALARARQELGAMTDAASAADTVSDENAEYSIHEVPGVGRYAVIRKTGWRALLKVIRDTANVNINFSVTDYPAFDGIIADKFKSPYLLDPLNNHYEDGTYVHLRDNIAAVRNFLMESYYVDTPDGMTPEKAKQAMEEIAKFVGEGLNNNYETLGFIAHHKPGKPFISISEASEPGGAGAQYIYEKILEMHRQSSWMRPFAPIIAFFGGHTPPDWKLPPAHQTEFTDLFSKDIAPHSAPGPHPDSLKQGIRNVEDLEAARARIIAAHELTHQAVDLNAMGDELMHSASTMQSVDHLSEPVQREAIELAKKILRGLRGAFGNVDLRNGLNLPPADDVAALGAMRGVAVIYHRMLSWASRIDGNIMQHPSVMAGTQAIGQLGYLAKLEGLRFAEKAGNTKLASAIKEQLEKVPEAYRSFSDAKLSGLLDKIEQGMNVMMTRVQTISGPTAKIGNSAAKDVGSSINQAPTAGLGQQATSSGHAHDDAAKRNAQMLAVENAHQQAQAARAQQNARRNETNPAQQPQQRQVTTRQLPGQIRTQTTRQTTTTTTTYNPANPAQRTNPNQQNQIARQAQLQHEQEEHDAQMRRQLEAQRQAQLMQQKAAAAKAAAQKIDPNILKNFQNATNTRGMGPVVTAKKPVTPAPAPQPTYVQGQKPATPGKPQEPLPPGTPIPPNRGGGGRGF